MARDPLTLFHSPVRRWFRERLGTPTHAQSSAWPAIAQGRSTLVLAPTGSGKTLAAFLAAIDRLMWSPEPARDRRCRVLYVSPLKALAVDLQRNLQAPLAGVRAAAEAEGQTVHIPAVDVRTGDTPSSARARLLRRPPDILITTPESLFLLLTSPRARPLLRSVETVILDEIHAVAATKRGSHLALSLERLEQLREPAPVPLQRIGLSATQRPLDEIARLLGGFDAAGQPRPVHVVDAGGQRPLELTVEVPDVDLDRLAAAPVASAGEAKRGRRGRRRENETSETAAPLPTIWPHIHARVLELVRQHRSTMVFVNSRRLAERFAAALNALAGEEVALAHHGSIARDKRRDIEERLKAGGLRAIVATSSLELGIDMGAVDLAIQIEAPGSVASGVQRIGRASHEVHGVPHGILVAKHRADLLACAAAAAAMRHGEIEPTAYPRNALDVLAQQVVAICSTGTTSVDELYSMVRRAAPYHELPRDALEGVLDMLSGRYPSDDFAELKPRLTWDRAAGTLQARTGARTLALTSGGTIPDRGLYSVVMGGDENTGNGGIKVGELDEEMVFELRLGEVFLLGASSWRAERITQDRVLVAPAPGQPGKMPFWHGDRVGRDLGFGRRVGRLARELAEAGPERLQELVAEHRLSPAAARNLVALVQKQVEATGDVPSDRTIVLERYVDDMGDWRVCLLAPLGLRVLVPWVDAIRTRLGRRYPGDIDAHVTDDGAVFRIPACDEPPPPEPFLPPASEIRSLVTDGLAATPVFAARFRECAARALLLPRRSPTRRTPLWAQRRRAGDLLAAASRYPSFPIILEAYRECLRDAFDMPGLEEVLAGIETRRVRVVTVTSRTPSPFAAAVLWSFVGDFMYLGDAPAAEQRARALAIDARQLRELLGEAAIRELLVPEVVEEEGRRLARLDRPLTNADAVHDLLLWGGDLSRAELRERGGEPVDALVDHLLAAGRAISVEVAGQARVAAVEDAARLRDGLGVQLPAHLPAALLQPAPAPLRDLLLRYARTHLPFPLEAAAARFGLPRAALEHLAEHLVGEGRLTEGELLPGGTGRELCDPEVLRVLRARSLARLRREAEPVGVDSYARFLLDWNGVTRPARGRAALQAAVLALRGAPLLASSLESELLPARVQGYQPWDLDALCAAGEVVWVGLEPASGMDGRIALAPAGEDLILHPPRRAEGALADRLRQVLERRGASFFRDLLEEVKGFAADVAGALWELVWAGEVTNDTFEPVRSRLGHAGSDRRSVQASRWSSTVRGTPPGTEGRWSLRRAGLHSEAESRTALVRSLLDRYGVLLREAAQVEGVPGGFSSIHDVLSALEERGQVRRGYFVSGRGGLQFALPGAAERLRAARERDRESSRALVLAATDPASPWGALLDWPARTENGATRPQRAAGALVVLHDGQPIGWLGRGDALLTFLPEDSAARAEAAAALAGALSAALSGPFASHGRHRRTMLIPTIDDCPAAESPLARFFVQAGFVPGARGLFKRAELSADLQP